MKKKTLAIIGATGLVGQTFLHILEEHNEDFELKLFASKKSEGKKLFVNNKSYIVHKLTNDSFKNIDYALFFTDASVSSIYIPKAIENNVKVIDNSSHFRMNDEVKLIAYGANEDLIDHNDNLISNPNCAVIQSIVPLYTLKSFGIKEISYNTYQSVSGSGKKGIDDLLRCRKGYMPKFYESDISFTCIPKIGELNKDGFTSEEQKMIDETRKILIDHSIDISATCIRVPVMFSHGVSVEVKLKEKFTVENIIDCFKNNSNIVVCDNILPTSILSCKSDKIYVGRIRKKHDRLLFYCVADNVRVGAASNAYNILKHMIKLGEQNG